MLVLAALTSLSLSLYILRAYIFCCRLPDKEHPGLVVHTPGCGPQCAAQTAPQSGPPKKQSPHRKGLQQHMSFYGFL